ncbi:MAG: DUF4185 domain-containing protein [Anaerolineae bacterium]|nr:DUF4185 domain-containing protein [Candidatus Roseilinea sp.]MDW8448397.1 DUF4185 domain-containing protein [Anaerolineae bacterium]
MSYYDYDRFLAPPARRLYYPPSQIVRGFEWTAPASKYPGTGSDMHWWTWADDDAIYCVDDDGANFGSPFNFANLLRVTGIPPNHTVELVSQFPGLKRYSIDKLRYVDGALAVGSRLYVAAYDYNFSDPGKEVFEIRGIREMPIREPHDGYFINAMSIHGGVAALMYSDDYGQTWHNIPDADTPYFLGPKFAGLAFVGFGPGYTGVPDWLGDYVYAISNDENWENGNHVFLARVPKDRVLDRSAWEFYLGGRDADNPQWTPDECAARPILSDPGHVGHPTMTYNAGLKRFFLMFGSDVVPHSFAMPRDFARRHWHRQRELQIYEGPAPWGPWALVHYEPAWEGEHVAYLPQMPSKWLSEDGLSGTLLFSGDYSMVKRPPGWQSYYGFMTRPFRLLV